MWVLISTGMIPIATNLLSRGFEYNMKSKKKAEVLTAFEVFEHLEDPLPEIEKMLTFSNNIFFSTELLPFPIPEPKDYWYYGFDHGQHISFYTPETLLFIARKYGLNYYNLGNLHLFSDNQIFTIILKGIKKRGKVPISFLKPNMKSRTFRGSLKTEENKYGLIIFTKEKYEWTLMIKISSIIIAKNEEENIRRCIESQSGCIDEIVLLVDEESIDKTYQIASCYSNVKASIIKWRGYSETKKDAISLTTNDWIFWIDADEAITRDLKEEIIPIQRFYSDYLQLSLYPGKQIFLEMDQA